MERRRDAVSAEEGKEFRKAVEFLWLVRCFLHYRHERDDNTLDWQAQDAAAEAAMGLTGRTTEEGGCGLLDAGLLPSCAERGAAGEADDGGGSGGGKGACEAAGVEAGAQGGGRAARVSRGAGTRGAGCGEASLGDDPAQDPDVVLQVFAAMARTGCTLGRDAEERLSQALPLLSAHLEEGPTLWHHLRGILTGPYAGDALRSMHALGVLELLIPEFHGIDALVIRDAYHRYTVDEHTFVLIDTLHGLERRADRGRWRSGRRGLAGCCGSCRIRGCCIWRRCCMTRARDGARAIMRGRVRGWRRACWSGWSWIRMRAGWC